MNPADDPVTLIREAQATIALVGQLITDNEGENDEHSARWSLALSGAEALLDAAAEKLDEQEVTP